MTFTEPLPELFASSRLLILDFRQIPDNTPGDENIQLFFEASEKQNRNPRLPENRQIFNNVMLATTSNRYLVSCYGEDRSEMLAGSQIAAEGRTLHMGIDIFSKDLEPVLAPCNGEIVRVGYEKQTHGYGHYVIIKPAGNSGVYIFLGHLSKQLPPLGPVRAGQQISHLGDHAHNENGGWSRHLHFQLVTNVPPEGETPIGYSTIAGFAKNSLIFPNPFGYFPRWHLA